MTREEAKVLLPIIQAFAEGKEIEFRSKGFDEEWKKVNEIPGLSYSSFDYRVKPEPKYRPFKDADECWQEMLKHEPFGWVVIIENNLSIKYNIQALVQDGVKSTAVLTDDVMSEKFPFEGVLQKFTFVDGTPFGIKNEEYVCMQEKLHYCHV